MANRSLLAALALWVAAVLTGFGALAVYSQAAGPQREPTSLLADDHPESGWRLVMAIHPKCACSRASLAELERLLLRWREQLRCEVFVYQPVDAPDDWSDTATARLANQLAEGGARTDPGGKEATSLGILTSGGVILYDSSGTPRYHGGLTPSRSHEGPSLATEAINSLLAGQKPAVTHRPVFGCRIVNEEAPQQ